MTFKADTNVLANYINDWAKQNKYVNSSVSLPSSGNQPYILAFTINPNSFESLFGFITDVIIMVANCTDIWGGIMLEMQS